MAAGVAWSNLRGEGPAPTADGGLRLVDPVCKMDVNAAWDIAHTVGGRTYHFCAEQCRDAFAAEPDKYLIERCMVCSAPVSPAAALPATYMDKTYPLCSEDHRRRFKADPAGFFMHRMWGIPDWMYYVSIAAVLVVSFLMFEGVAAFRGLRRRKEPFQDRRAPRHEEPRASARAALQTPGLSTSRETTNSADSVAASPRPHVAASADTAPHGAASEDDRRNRIDLLRFTPIRRMLLSRPFRFTVQLAMASCFLLIIAAGLFGNQNPALNIAPILTWTIWWGGLVVLILFAGKAWCYMCPWEAIAFWTERLRLWKKTDRGTGLGMRWPRVVRNIGIATVLFVGLTWVELGFGVTTSPKATAYLGLAMLVMAVVSAFLFDRKSFCRYGCLVGRISGLYALFSGVEIRARSRDICRACRTKECVRGSDNAYGCPTFEYVGKMETNTYCIQCTECLQACPHDNLAVNLRPWGADLAVEGHPRSDEAYLALLMLALTGFHGLTMTPVWRTITEGIESALPLGRIASFSLGMFGLMAVPVTIYAALVGISYRITRRSEAASSPISKRRGDTGPTRPGSDSRLPISNLEAHQSSYRDYFIRYAYCVLPIALFYHLAHNLEHLLMEGQKVIALFSDPFGWGWNVFGTAGWVVPPLVSLDVLWVLQVLLVGVGHVYSLWAARMISRRLFANATAASRGQIPMLIGMIAFSVLSLWLLKQPMEMRTSAM